MKIVLSIIILILSGYLLIDKTKSNKDLSSVFALISKCEIKYFQGDIVCDYSIEPSEYAVIVELSVFDLAKTETVEKKYIGKIIEPSKGRRSGQLRYQNLFLKQNEVLEKPLVLFKVLVLDKNRKIKYEKTFTEQLGVSIK